MVNRLTGTVPPTPRSIYEEEKKLRQEISASRNVSEP